MKAKSVCIEVVHLMVKKYNWKITQLKHDKYDRNDVTEWLNSNCKGSCRFSSNVFAFQYPDDALVFRLIYS